MLPFKVGTEYNNSHFNHTIFLTKIIFLVDNNKTVKLFSYYLPKMPSLQGYFGQLYLNSACSAFLLSGGSNPAL